MEQIVQWKRRAFLGRVGGAGVISGWVLAGTPLAMLTTQRAWAVDLKALGSTQGRTLLAVCRTIAPHDKLDDAAYALVVGSIDDAAGRDSNLLGLLRAGCTGLDAQAPFAGLDEAARVAALKLIEPTPFFQFMRVNTLQNLYATPLAAALFGYEGESFSKGGYLHRGFNDLRWLPEVPAADSGSLPY